jgi:hypothetical protein
MPSATATVTGVTGPGRPITALVLPNVTLMDLEPVTSALKFKYGNGQRLDVDITTATTFTVAISGGNFTVTVS